MSSAKKSGKLSKTQDSLSRSHLSTRNSTTTDSVLSSLAALPKAKRNAAALSLIKKLEKLVDKPEKKKGGKNSQAWKDLERLAADHFKGRRLSRGSNFAIEDVDVIVDFRALRVDGKYRRAHAHHTFMAEIERKYCEKDGDVPVLVTKHPGQQGAFVTVPIEHYGLLLDCARYIVGMGYVIPQNTTQNQMMDRLNRLRHKPFKQKDSDDDR